MAVPNAVRIKRQDGTWQDIAIQGPQGPRGLDGAAGPAGPAGVAGPPAYDNAPLGSIQGWTRKAVPDGWVMCDGAVYTQAAYPEAYAMAQAEVAAANPLWAVAGTNFTVPNLTDRFILGPGASRGLGTRSQTDPAQANAGEETHKITIAELASHGHPFTSGASAAVTNAQVALAAGSTWVANHVAPYYVTPGITGGDAAHNNMPPYVVVGMIVKVKGATVTAGAITGPKGDKGDAADPTPLDTWHVVGAAGEPAFGTGWSSYPAEVPVAFRKDPFGRVMLRGLAQIGSTPNTGPIFTLPVGYRPPNGFVRFPLYRGGDTTMWTAYVGIDGRVMLFQAPSATQYYDLAPIEFDTDSVTSYPAGPKGAVGAQGPQGQSGGGADLWRYTTATQIGPTGVTSTAPGDVLINPPAITTRNVPHFFEMTGVVGDNSGSAAVTFALYEGAAQIGVCTFNTPNAGIDTFFARIPFTPTAGSHTYTVRWIGGTAGRTYTIYSTTMTTVARIYECDQAGPQGPQGPKGDAPDATAIDGWHIVGDGATGLGTTFTNGWVNFAGQYPTAAFRKSPLGKVQLRGMIKTGTVSTSAFTLPAGYRPIATQDFPVAQGPSLNQVATVEINTSGTVYVYGANTAIDLGAIEFDTDLVTTFPIGPRGLTGPSGATAYNLPTCRCATTGNVNLASGAAPAFDGVVLGWGDLVLVWAQTNPVENGLYVYAGPGQALIRHDGAKAGIAVEAGARVYTTDGVLFGDRDFYVTTRALIGTDALRFSPPRNAALTFTRVPGDSSSGSFGTAAVQIAGLTTTLPAMPIPVDWEIYWFLGQVQKTDAVYGYAYPGIKLTPVDLDGRGVLDYGLRMQHSGVQTYEPYEMRRTYRLAAGQAYTAQVMWAASQGTWVVQTGPGYAWLEARATVS